MSFTQYFVLNVKPRLNFPYWPTAGSLYFLLPVFIISSPTYAAILSYNFYRKSTKTRRNQLRYVFIGSVIGFSGGATNYFLFYDIPIPPIGNILVSVFGIFVTLAIIKHQLMDIRIVIKRGIIYSISIALLSLFYLISVFILEKLTQLIFDYHSLVISIGAAFIIGLLFMPLRQKLQQFMDRYFFKGSPEEIVAQNEQLRQEIIQAEKYKTLSTLASGIAHEVKNPLTAIKTFTEYLPDKLNDKEFLMKFSDIVGKEVDRINDMTHQLLDYGKPAPLAIKETNIHKLINGTLDILNSKFIHHKIKVVKDYRDDHNFMIHIDPNQIRQALMNIFLNAVEAMDRGGTLTVTTSLSETGFFVIKIEDTGVGMSKEELAQAFDPFFSKKDDGTGLGLSITQSLIENHKGIIQMKSRAGGGTTVRIDLPC